MDVFFLGLTDSMIARELDRYQNPEPAEPCWDDIDFPTLDCYWCHKPEGHCTCMIAKCEACGKDIIRSAKQKCVTEFIGLRILNKVYHADCFKEAACSAAA